MLRFFIAGIIQGSKPDTIHGQDYRERIRAALSTAFPDAEVFCPFENHPNSIDYGDDQAREVFLDLVQLAGDSDVVVAYVPEASMGTGVEMWHAFHAGRLVIAVSPLDKNWVVRFLSHHVCAGLDAFDEFVSSGGLRRLMAQRGLV